MSWMEEFQVRELGASEDAKMTDFRPVMVRTPNGTVVSAGEALRRIKAGAFADTEITMGDWVALIRSVKRQERR